MREFRGFTQASPTNLTSEGAAYSLPFAWPSRYGGVVSSIEQVFSGGSGLFCGAKRLGVSLHNETHLFESDTPWQGLALDNVLRGPSWMANIIRLGILAGQYGRSEWC
jgi:hypothetical protein